MLNSLPHVSHPPQGETPLCDDLSSYARRAVGISNFDMCCLFGALFLNTFSLLCLKTRQGECVARRWGLCVCSEGDRKGVSRGRKGAGTVQPPHSGLRGSSEGKRKSGRICIVFWLEQVLWSVFHRVEQPSGLLWARQCLQWHNVWLYVCNELMGSGPLTRDLY